MADEPAKKDADKEAEDETPKGRVNTIVAIAVVVMLIVVAAGVFFSFRFVENERARVLNEWQIRMGIVADSRVAAVNEWIQLNFDTVAELTENASLQLYITELQQAAGNKGEVTDGQAQLGYLRNLLVAIADRSGFVPPVAAEETNSNVEAAGVAGMALIDAEGRPIVITPQMPPLNTNLRTALAKSLDGTPAIIDMYMGATNKPTIGFSLPIFSVQGDSGSKGIGVAMGVRVVDEELSTLLKQPGDTTKTSETFLVRKTENTVDYLTPLKDGTAALKRSMDLSTADLAAAFAVEKPGGFAIKRDYAGDDVLVISRAIADVPWVLVRKITTAEALAANESRLRNILIVFVLIIVGVTIAMIAVWRHGTSLRAAAAAEKFRISSERFENISKFMRVITNSQPTHIIAVDGTTTYTFANEPAAKAAGVEPPEMLGKTMAGVMGPIKAKFYAEINKDLLKEFADAEEAGMENSVQRTRKQCIERFELEDGELQVIKSDHIPLRGDRDHPPGILMIMDDITEYSKEQMRSEQRLRQMVNTLAAIVDKRDRDASERSSRVAEVARAIAEELELKRTDVDTAEFAAALRNLGTVLSSPEFLAKPLDQLNPSETAELDNPLQVSADLLEKIDFEGPVVDSIRHSGERFDGHGPMGLEGESILMPGRIVAVADAFLNEVNPQNGTAGASFTQATDILLLEAGAKYDRRVITALMNRIENHGGAQQWAHLISGNVS